MRAIRFSIPLIAVALALLIGCETMAPPAGSTARLGPAGGEVSLPSGAKVIVPAGALGTDVEIEIVAGAADAPRPAASLKALGQSFALLPHGMRFNSPVTIHVPFDPAQVPNGVTPRLYKAPLGGSFGEVPSRVEGQVLVAEIDSFSFVQAQGPAGSAGGAARILVVDRPDDATDGGDGRLSLREAVAQAADGEPTEIRFDPAALFDEDTAIVTRVELQGELQIPPGANLVIDGSLTIPVFNAIISGPDNVQMRERLITVESDAKLTLRDMRLANGAEQGAGGVNGVDGVHGTNGQGCAVGVITCHTGQQGGDGTDGQDASVSPTSGGDGVGGILNRGTLTLERVHFDRLEAHGGPGGHGGAGGRGGRGGTGGDESEDRVVPPFSGGHGGHAGAATHGADGGVAAGAVLNLGTLIVRDVRFSNLVAAGGRGGNGGDGGDGGDGGHYGRSQFRMPPYTWRGGDGGDAGPGGNAGDGGAAAGAIFNLGGELMFDGVQGAPAAVTATGGHPGQAGEAGNPGFYGFERDSTRPETDLFKGEPGMPAATDDGMEKPQGDNGAPGLGQHFVNASPTIDNCMYVDVAAAEYSEGGSAAARTVYVLFGVIGDTPAGQSVRWSFTPGPGVTAEDFASGLPSGGLVEFDGASSTTRSFIVAADGVDEDREAFTITLSAPMGGQLGWSRSVTVTITD